MLLLQLLRKKADFTFALICLITFLSLIAFACVETVQLQTSPTSDAGANVLPSADAAAVTAIEVFPSSARFANGGEHVFKVVTRVGSIEALAPFTAATEDGSIVSVLATNQADRTVIVKGRGVGVTNLVVRSGGVQTSAEIKVVAASAYYHAGKSLGREV